LVVLLTTKGKILNMTEYKTHGFNKKWHKKVEEFIEKTDQPFENTKYFIKYCVNQYIQQETSKKDSDKALNELLEELKKKKD